MSCPTDGLHPRTLLPYPWPGKMLLLCSIRRVVTGALLLPNACHGACSHVWTHLLSRDVRAAPPHELADGAQRRWYARLLERDVASQSLLSTSQLQMLITQLRKASSILPPCRPPHCAHGRIGCKRSVRRHVW